MKTFVHEEAYRGEEALKAIEGFGEITVCGCGAIGSNLLDNLARQGYKNLATIDMDRVEDHNRNTQVWGRREVGQLKVAAMRNRLHQDMGVMLKTEQKKLEEDNIKKLLKSSALVIDGFDNTEARALVKSHCEREKIDCLHIGMYEDYAEVIWNENYRVPQARGKDVCEYPLSRNIALLAVVVASDVIARYIIEAKRESYAITLKDFKVSLLED